MENQNVPDELILKDLLAIIDIASSGCHITLDDPHEINAYVTYLSYRVQQDLYKVCMESGLFHGLLWDEFVLLMRGNQPARAAAVVVMRETLRDFCYRRCFNFAVTEVNLPDSIAAGDEILHCAGLFSAEEGKSFIGTIMFQAEVAQYRQLLEQGTSDSWTEYLDKLSQKGPQWRQVYAAARDAIMRFDFKPVWKSEELEKLVNRAKGSEV